MESIRTKEIYGEEWFKKRAISSITRIDNTSWDYSDSILLYLPGHDETYEYVQSSENQYNEIVTSPEQKYLDGVASKITEILPVDFDYVDLGPGTEHKEQYIFDELKNKVNILIIIQLISAKDIWNIHQITLRCRELKPVLLDLLLKIYPINYQLLVEIDLSHSD